MTGGQGPLKMPAPNLQGNYEGSCVVCMRGTDTALAFTGEPEWVTAGMMNIGIPQKQASLMLSDATGCEPGKVPDGSVTMTLRLCESCLSSSRLGSRAEVGLLPDDVPHYGQPRTAV